MEGKLKWIKIISDNGAHYHNSQLMMIIAYWYNWYNIDVKSWTFLEPGETKTAVDSHHTSKEEVAMLQGFGAKQASDQDDILLTIGARP
ncbi:hypothetical protein C1645_838222 [Glomus cerebriforme]|uniref:Uncharacterized protein n=1 Tax=Glomus cerebriforme TaxID=658196 RepID=A0A397S7K1_9GLOM|nr:hypothetical protein C1645_838222 [Glomus cerebriforme]